MFQFINNNLQFRLNIGNKLERFFAKYGIAGGLGLFASVFLVFAQPTPSVPTPTPVGGVSGAGSIGDPTGSAKPTITDLAPQRQVNVPEEKGESQQSIVPESFPLERPRNEFQQLIARVTGQSLPIFGVNLFFQRDGFSPANNLPVTDDYVVGPGDELIIRAWGQIDINLELTVDSDGAINIPQVGVLQLEGIKASQIEGFIKTAVGRLFKDFELNVTFGRLRSIKVLVVGHVGRPGNYTVSPLSTALGALFQAGGPSLVGSMRKIEVKRANQVVSELDMYDLLIKGDNTKDIRLLHGDIIRVLPMGSLAALTGSVQSPAIYELKGTETIGDMVKLGMGLTATAFKGRVIMERIKDNSLMQIKEIPLDGAGYEIKIQNGDMVRILPISPRLDKVVTIRGHVAAPRRVIWTEGMRLKDLIPDVSNLIPYEYWIKKNRMGALDRATGGERVSVLEANKGLLSEINWQYSTINRLNSRTLENEVLTFNLGAAIRENDPAENHILKPGDVITVYNRTDIGVPKASKDSLVTLRGEIVNPGVYRVKYGETLGQLVERVGGFTLDAYPYASVFTRESVRVEQQKRLDEGITRMEKELAQATAKLQARTLDLDVKAGIQSQMESKAKSVALMRRTMATGRISLNLKQTISLPQSLPDVELKDGDTYFVPPKFNEVHIMGEVFNQQSTIWRSGNTVLDILATAGGPTRQADMKQIFLIHADGTVLSYAQTGKKFIKEHMYPGDTLVVPKQMEFSNWKYDLKEWPQIFADYAIGAAALRVLSGGGD